MNKFLAEESESLEMTPVQAAALQRFHLLEKREFFIGYLTAGQSSSSLSGSIFSSVSLPKNVERFMYD